MKRLMPLLLLILSTSIWIHAEDASSQELFLKANTLLEKGDRDEALTIYKSLIAQGYESSELYYNLGNYYYRSGDRGNAILWYERAKNITPRDSDIQYNLTLARSHMKKEIKNFPENLINYFTLNELAVALSIFSAAFFILLGLIILNWVQGEAWPGLVLWINGFLLVFISVWFGAHLNISKKPWAIINNPPGEVRNGPGPEYAVGFTIPQGSKVVILNQRPVWSEIGVPQEGLKGWIQTNEIELIQKNSI